MISLLAAAAVSATIQVTPCHQLTELSLPDTRVESAELIGAAIFKWPDGVRVPPHLTVEQYQPKLLPKHCKVNLELTPTSNSSINVEVWLPEDDWNGKFLVVGNGLWAGTVQNYQDMESGLLKGYAVASSDGGHSPDNIPFTGMFALGQPEKIIDFAYRAIHAMTVRGKQVVTQHYDRPIEYSYFKGCSTGGRQGVMAAQRYPGDFDGIIASALANQHISMHTASVASHVDLARHPEKAIDAETAQFVSQTILEHCDTRKEGFVQNPAQCQFDFSSLKCGNSTSESCLSTDQLKTVETFYNGLHMKSGEPVFAGQPLGNALPAQISNDSDPFVLVFDTVRILGFQDADYDWRNFNLDRDLPHIKAVAGFVDATDTDLSSFKAHGGKLLIGHGWRDTAISAHNTVTYYNDVLEDMGPEQSEWMRLFMVPGMDHCGGGPGLYEFDQIEVLEQWREQGKAPKEIIASNPHKKISRPLCPHPSFAEYKGNGDMKVAENWECSAP